MGLFPLLVLQFPLGQCQSVFPLVIYLLWCLFGLYARLWLKHFIFYTVMAKLLLKLFNFPGFLGT